MCSGLPGVKLMHDEAMGLPINVLCRDAELRAERARA